MKTALWTALAILLSILALGGFISAAARPSFWDLVIGGLLAWGAWGSWSYASASRRPRPPRIDKQDPRPWQR